MAPKRRRRVGGTETAAPKWHFPQISTLDELNFYMSIVTTYHIVRKVHQVVHVEDILLVLLVRTEGLVHVLLHLLQGYFRIVLQFLLVFVLGFHWIFRPGKYDHHTE